MRLELYLSSTGVASRRASAEIIKTGRVRVNKNIVTRPGYRLQTDDLVFLDNDLLFTETEKIYLMMNKPIRTISSSTDTQNRMTVIDLVQDSFPQRLFCVGRLDFMSTGLILITNDGNFAYKITHPKFGIEKTYDLETTTSIPQRVLHNWKSGLRIAGSTYKLESYTVLGKGRVQLNLLEGKNREIRKVCATYNLDIKRLHRVQIGSLRIGKLQPGKFRQLSKKEIHSLLGKF